MPSDVDLKLNKTRTSIIYYEFKTKTDFIETCR